MLPPEPIKESSCLCQSVSQSLRQVPPPPAREKRGPSCKEVGIVKGGRRERQSHPSCGHLGEGGVLCGSLPGEMTPAFWECFPREHVWSGCSFPPEPCLKWPNRPKGLAPNVSSHMPFALPACPGQPSSTRRRHSSSGIQVSRNSVTQGTWQLHCW